VGADSRGHQASGIRRRQREPRLSKGDARELALLNATEELLTSAGAGGLTVAAITERANLSRSAFYFYFAAKEEAVGRLGQHYLGGVLEAAGPALDPAVPLEEGVRAAISKQVEVWERHGPVLSAVADMASVDGTIRELWTDAVEAFIEPIRERMAGLQRERGEPPSPHNRVRAEALVWMLERYYRVWASGRYDHSPKLVVDTLYEVCIAMLKL
jgi:AcrR family transcriptional regulator